MNKRETLDFLTRRGIAFELTEHPAVFTMKELSDVAMPYPDGDAKNLFVRDDKKRQYDLITVRGNKRVDLKAFRRANGTRPLSFANEAELAQYLSLSPGSVTPLGLLNDETRRVRLFLDEEFLGGSGKIGVHPNDNTATVWLKTDDLIALIREHGNEVLVIPIDERA